jgi:hypothetical protein
MAATAKAAVQTTTLTSQAQSNAPPTSGNRAIYATPYVGMYGAMSCMIDGRRLSGTRRPPKRERIPRTGPMTCMTFSDGRRKPGHRTSGIVTLSRV